MKKTDETIDGVRPGLDDLEGRADGRRGGVHRRRRPCRRPGPPGPSACRSSSRPRPRRTPAPRVTPWWARSCGVLLGEAPRAARRSAGSISWASPRSMPRSAAFLRIASTSPSRVRSQTSRRSSTSAARSTRSSVPSGSTTRRRSERACSSSSCSNIIGVTRPLRATEIRSQQLGGVHVPLEEAERGLRLARASPRSACPPGRRVRPRWGRSRRPPTTTGVPGASRAASVRISSPGRSSRVSSTPGDRRGAGAVRGQRADDQVGPVARA